MFFCIFLCTPKQKKIFLSPGSTPTQTFKFFVAHGPTGLHACMQMLSCVVTSTNNLTHSCK